MSKPNWGKIQEEWETTKKTYKQLEEQFNVKSSTIRSRKNREKWQRNATENATQQKKSVATKNGSPVASDKKRVTSKKRKKRSGNPNPKNQFTERNSAALIHGLRSKFLHAEQVEIMESLEGSSFADQLWLQIEIKFSAIIRMQKIMWVDDENDHLKEVSGETSNFEGDSTSYKVVYAHERFESYVRAQARAMAEYRNLIKQFIEITDEFDERRVKLESMQSNIDKAKAETDRITSESKEDVPPTVTIIDAWADADD